MVNRKAIHRRFEESRYERAEFLWSLYRGFSAGHQRNLTGFYLDIGSGNLANAILFRRRTGADEGIGVDIARNLTGSQEISVVRADARALPFRTKSFAFVTNFSLIEHVIEPLVFLSEALRVLRDDGEFFMQFPNRYFPVELHSGQMMYFYWPRRIRNWLAVSSGIGWMKEIEVPSLLKVKKMLRQVEPACDVTDSSFYYPESLLPDSSLIKKLYRVIQRLRLFTMAPMGYCVLVRRHGGASGYELV